MNPYPPFQRQLRAALDTSPDLHLDTLEDEIESRCQLPEVIEARARRVCERSWKLDSLRARESDMSGLDAEHEILVARRIAISAYHSFRFALHNKGPRDQDLPSWDGLPEEAQDGWFRAVFVVKSETEEVDHLPWQELAQKAYAVYAKAVGEGAGNWEHLELRQKVAWEAASRHILSLFEADNLSEEDVEKMECDWLAWADKRNQV